MHLYKIGLSFSCPFFVYFSHLLRWVLDDEGGELVTHVHGVDVAAGLAARADHVLLHLHKSDGSENK